MNTNISLSIRDFISSFFSKSTSKSTENSISTAPSKEKKGSPKGQPKTSVSIIGQGCKIVGNVQVDNDVRFEGTLEGDIICENAVILGEQSKITGNINAKDLTIAGTYQGDINVSQIIKLKKTAIINGNIVAPKMMAEYGSSINGKCQIGA